VTLNEGLWKNLAGLLTTSKGRRKCYTASRYLLSTRRRPKKGGNHLGLELALCGSVRLPLLERRGLLGRRRRPPRPTPRVRHVTRGEFEKSAPTLNAVFLMPTMPSTRSWTGITCGPPDVFIMSEGWKCKKPSLTEPLPGLRTLGISISPYHLRHGQQIPPTTFHRPNLGITNCPCATLQWDGEMRHSPTTSLPRNVRYCGVVSPPFSFHQARLESWVDAVPPPCRIA
jgi:hypothetical protein